MEYIGWILIGFIALLGLWVIIGSRKKRCYLVYLANNDILLLWRDLNERWWRTNDRYLRFKNEEGKEITFPSNAHWVLMWEEVPNNEISLAREKIQNMKEKLAKELDS